MDSNPSGITDGFLSVGNSVANLPTYFKNPSVKISDEHFNDGPESVGNPSVMTKSICKILFSSSDIHKLKVNK